MPNPPNPPVAPEPPLPTFAFPFRTKDGKALVDEHIFYQWLADENTGNFAVSSSGMWHGGIHVSADGAGRHLDLVHGVRCIAAGEIIAYRINRAPLISEIAAEDDQPVTTLTGHYSSAFTLVRHTLEYPAGNRLAFFSLYMHLQSVAEYEQKSMQPPAYWARAYEVTEHAADKPKASASTPIPDEHIGLNIHTEPGSPTMLGILPRGAQVRIGETRKKGLWGKIEAIESGTILPPKVASQVLEGADKGWVFLGKKQGHLLLKPIISQAQSDEVIVPATPIRINANDLIGHLGQYWRPDHPEQEHRMVHIEVFCGSDLPDFLAKTRAAAKDVIDLSKLPLLHIDKGVKLFQVKKADAQGHPVYEEGADAPQTAVVQIYSQAALDAFPAEHKGPKDNGPGPGQPWWYVTSANSRHEDISGWVRNRQMPPNGGVMRESPHAWIDFETVTGDDGANPTMCRSVDGYLDYALNEDKPATGDIRNLKPLACNFYRALSPMRNEARAADELRALKDNKWLRFRASRLMPKHRSEWASQREYESFFETVLKRIDEEPYHDAEIERLKKLVWWDEVSAKVGQPFPSSPEVFHIHPIALTGNFIAVAQYPVIVINGEKIELDFLRKNSGERIEEADYVTAAQILGCEVAAIKAVAKTETGGSGSYFRFSGWDDVPSILYERHYFHNLTSGAFTPLNHDISNPVRGGYGAYNIQYGKLLKACNLNKSAALQSASWGKFQIMGKNHAAAGYATVEEFVLDISRSEKNHLKAFVNFIKSDPVLRSSIVSKNWHAFAIKYNGQQQVGYDTQMSTNYNAIVNQ